MIDKNLPTLKRVIEELSKFPGVGRKSAMRLALHAMRASRSDMESLAESLIALKDNVKFCSKCHGMTEVDPCPICSDETRDNEVVVVVSRPQDMMVLERSGAHRGAYHVLHGTLSPLNGVGPDDLRIDSLEAKVRSGTIKEIVVATGFDVEGEATALYLSRLLRPYGVVVSRLAHGIPVGGDLEYLDDATVGLAIEARRTMGD